MIYSMECLRQDMYASLHLLSSSFTYCSLQLVQHASLLHPVFMSPVCLMWILSMFFVCPLTAMGVFLIATHLFSFFYSECCY